MDIIDLITTFIATIIGSMLGSSITLMYVSNKSSIKLKAGKNSSNQQAGRDING